MAVDDLSPIAKLRIAKACKYIAIAAIVIGVVGAVLVALSPAEGPDETRKNILFGLACCIGPSLLAAIPISIVGRMLARSVRESDEIGSMYRGW